MKRFIFLSSEGQTIAPNPDCEVNNLQVIGIVEDVTNGDEALKKLLKENSWIWESGFNVADFILYELK